eukprot:7766097-Lingulodinium_polyedra.AAC.1
MNDVPSTPGSSSADARPSIPAVMKASMIASAWQCSCGAQWHTRTLPPSSGRADCRSRSCSRCTRNFSIAPSRPWSLTRKGLAHGDLPRQRLVSPRPM